MKIFFAEIQITLPKIAQGMSFQIILIRIISVIKILIGRTNLFNLDDFQIGSVRIT